MNISSFNKKAFQTDLIKWFEQNKRQLPWREDQDPYKVWVSEIMLQQTQVDTVIPYFENFIEKFPDPNSLADADQQEVLKAWEGLGYYSRARNLQSAVQEVKETYNGEVPRDRKQLSKLKGIGPYTLGAIMSIAYDAPEPAVDGNVMRVISRVFEIEADIAKAKTKKVFEALIREIISTEDPSSFNQGLMELGALVCRPKNPKCELCPIQAHCQAYQQNSQTKYPVKSKNKKQQSFSYYVFVLENKSGEILIEKRPETGLLAGLWQFPMVEQGEIDQKLLIPFAEELFQTNIIEMDQLESIKHIFSHVTWSMDVFHLKIDAIAFERNSQQLVKHAQLDKYPFPVPHQKIIKQL
ncbi:A/G-specific adenine glycosylase [Amphibacillus sp. Q70]|uniref:A/G-specific adenine glycosylase n=1 Tax=Amphibacillus sp. Q70 TaxID=3453416 RepID=UPI003F83B97A